MLWSFFFFLKWRNFVLTEKIVSIFLKKQLDFCIKETTVFFKGVESSMESHFEGYRRLLSRIQYGQIRHTNSPG